MIHATRASFPLIGEEVGHLRANLRRFCQGQYLIFFEPRENGIDLIRVLHGSQRIEDNFA